MKTIRSTLLIAILSTTAGLWGITAQAQPAQNETSAKTAQGTGVVKKIDTVNKRITLAHDPIKALSWPAMTMPFPVKDAALLKGLQPGDKVDFVLQNGQTITKINKK